MTAEDSSNTPFALVADFKGDIDALLNVETGDSLPLLPVRNTLLFPSSLVPIMAERPFSKAVIRDAIRDKGFVGLVYQKDAKVEKPSKNDFYGVGTIARIIKTMPTRGSRLTVFLQGFNRFKLLEVTQTEPYYEGKIEQLKEQLPDSKDKEFRAIVDACKDQTRKLLILSNSKEHPETVLETITHPIFLINFICTNLPIEIGDKIKLLEEEDVKARALALSKLLRRELQFAELKARIENDTRAELNQQQKEYFLHQQMQKIQDELGDTSSDDYTTLEKEATKKKMPKAVATTFDKELKKLRRLNPQSPDYNVQLNYLQTVLNLPWNTFTRDSLDIKRASRILERDHYGLEKIKERILEELAVISLRGNFKAPILCFYGPPGIGKTSLGKSIAEALKRKYVRISLGGVHDEAEIRGHRRTYVGAMPGRILQSLVKAGSSNPVFVLDEIDKVSEGNINGNPASALLEVLDPEQNVAFHDNFVDLDFDLSNVFFIATANNLATIPQALADRMEIIEMTGYITEEKIEIARRHLIPKKKKAMGFDKNTSFRFSRAAIEKIIEGYTRESGVRQLEKKIEEIFRKLAVRSLKGELPKIVTIEPKDLPELLGVERFTRDTYEGNEYAGVVTGLAWTSVGGEILYIETSLSKGKEHKLTLTGNLGDVMKESAMLALEYIKANVTILNVDPRIFDYWNIHIHVPEGAVPKDGPSAGITIATSIASALTQRKVRKATAMTGEMTLRGEVLPVGGIKEKILAAKRAGITTIILSEKNKKDINEIPDMYLKGVDFEYVHNVKEVLKLALLEEKISDPVCFDIDESEGKLKG